MPDDLTATVGRLGDATREFTEAVRGLKRRQTWVIILVGTTFLGTLLTGAVGYRLYDCTTPGIHVPGIGRVGGDCYRTSQQRTAGIVGELNEGHGVLLGEIRKTCQAGREGNR